MEKKKKKLIYTEWWKEELRVELDEIEHNYFINREWRKKNWIS